MKARIATLSALLRASARVVRREPKLLVFPLLSVFLFGGAFASFLLPAILSGVWMLHVDFVLFLGIVMALPFAALLAAYLGGMFCQIALADAALTAFRGERVHVWRALADSVRRWRAVLAYSAIVLVGDGLISLVPFGRQVLAGVPWLLDSPWRTIVMLTAPVLAKEKRGATDSIRRAASLAHAAWGEDRSAVVGVGMLFLVSIAITYVARHVAVSLGVEAAPATIAFWGLAGAQLSVSLLIRFFTRIYAAALYTFAAEGAVPTEFDSEELAAVWRSPASPGAAGSAASLAAAGTHVARPTARARKSRWHAVAGFAFVVAGGAAIVALTWFSVLRAMPAPIYTTRAVPLERGYFPDPFSRAWSTTFPGDVMAIAALPWSTPNGERQFAVAGPESVDIVSASGVSLRSFPNPETRGRGFSILPVDAEGARRVIVVGTEGFTAFDESGRELWHHHGGVGNVAVLRSQGRPTALAVDWKSDLCIFTLSGQKRRCRSDMSNIWFVAALDCNGDGEDEIVSTHAFDDKFKPGRTVDGRAPVVNDDHVVCYDRNLARTAVIDRTTYPNDLTVADVDDDGHDDLVILDVARDGLFDRTDDVLVARTPSGRILAELRVSGELGATGAFSPLTHGRFSPGARRAIVSGGRSGLVVGIMPDGRRFGLRAPKQWYGNPVAALDVDGDGVDELLVGAGREVHAMRWGRAVAGITSTPHAAPPPR